MIVQKNRNIVRRYFTLVEIMVALTLLLLMMSFLFEFVISSQRLWTASEHKISNFDDGQLVLDIVGEDVRNMVYSNEVGKSLPFCYRKIDLDLESDPTPDPTASIYMFFTQDNSLTHNRNVGIAPVCYVCFLPKDNAGSKWAGRLYRVLLDVDWEHFNKDFAGVGLTGNAAPKGELDTLFTTDVKQILDDVTQEPEVLIVDSVRTFDFYVEDYSATPGATSYYSNEAYLKSKPNVITLRTSIYDKNAINAEELADHQSSGPQLDEFLRDYERNFTKSIPLR